jgi:hypothetical protein
MFQRFWKLSTNFSTIFLLIRNSGSIHVDGFGKSQLTKKMGGVILVMVTRRGGVQVSWMIDAKISSGSVRIVEPDEPAAIQHSHCSATE